MHSIRKFALLGMTVALGSALAAAGPAMATGPTPNVTVQSAGVTTSGDAAGTLNVTFRATALGGGGSANVNLTGGAWSITTGCKTHNGNFPQGLQSENGPAIDSNYSLQVDKNGSLRGTITFLYTFWPKCGGGQTRALVSASYTGLSLTVTNSSGNSTSAGIADVSYQA